MYQTETLLRRKLRVRYPAGRGQMVLRTELDWDRDTEPFAVSDDGETSTFALEARKPFLYFKCVLKAGDSGERWSVGANFLLTMTTEDVADVFPHFDDPETGSFSPVIERDSASPRPQAPPAGVPPARLPREHAAPLPGALHAGRQEPLLPRRGVPGAGVGRRRGRAPARHDERCGPRGDRGRPLGRPDGRVHEAGLRGLRPLRGRGDQARGRTSASGCSRRRARRV